MSKRGNMIAKATKLWHINPIVHPRALRFCELVIILCAQRLNIVHNSHSPSVKFICYAWKLTWVSGGWLATRHHTWLSSHWLSSPCHPWNVLQVDYFQLHVGQSMRKWTLKVVCLSHVIHFSFTMREASSVANQMSFQ